MVTSRWLSGSFATALAFTTLLLSFHHFHIVVEAVEALGPELLVIAEPAGSLCQRRRVEANGAELSAASARDEGGALEKLPTLGDGRLAEAERGDELVDRCLAVGKACKDGASRRVGESCEHEIEALGSGSELHH